MGATHLHRVRGSYTLFPMIPVLIQISGFVGALVALILTYRCHINPIWFVAAFAFHFAGDLLFVAEEGVPKMSFIDNLGNYVKLPSFLQFVGIMLMGGAMFFSRSMGVKLVGFPAFGLALAGFVYEKIYQ